MTKAESLALAHALRKARERLAETQTQFAARIGVNQATISRWEEDGPRNGPSRNTVKQAIADTRQIGTKA